MVNERLLALLPHIFNIGVVVIVVVVAVVGLLGSMVVPVNRRRRKGSIGKKERRKERKSIEVEIVAQKVNCVPIPLLEQSTSLIDSTHHTCRCFTQSSRPSA